jgi:Carboxypeptidase regulatory-like domain
MGMLEIPGRCYVHGTGAHKMRRATFVVLLILCFVGLSSSVLLSQEVASLTGVVTDATGAVVAGVTVTLLDTKTNSSYVATTNSVGAYTFPKVLPGPGYSLNLRKDGFASATVLNMYLGVGAPHTQNVHLELGAVTQSVEVNGSRSEVTLNTSDATVGNNFDMNLVHQLPVQVRDNPAEIMRLQPGVTSAAQIDDPNQSRDGATTGARTDQGNVSVDGLDVNDFNAGFSLSVVGNAPVDSIQEFRGETANPLSAEGRGSGIQVQMVTKSGTNNWHGSVYEYNRNTDFEANTFLNNLSIPAVPREQLVRNQFGVSLGGPVKKNKLFFFFNYEGRRDAATASTEAIVPLPSFAAGNVSYINSGPGCSPSSRINTQPACISTIPQSSATPGAPTLRSFDPLGLGFNDSLQQFISGRYPAPNDLANAGDGVNTAGLRFNAPADNVLNNYVVRLDYNLNSKMRVFARGSIERNPADGTSNNFSIALPGDPVTAVIVDHSYAFVFGHTWTISNDKVNQFVYGENRQVFKFPILFNPTGTTVYSVFDSTGNGGTNLSSPYIPGTPQGRVIPIPIFKDDFTYTRGTHIFQVGGNFKPIETHTHLTNDVNDVTLGLGGGLTGLDASLRPADILSDSDGIAANLWDSAFAFGLGRFGAINSSFNNDKQLNPLPQGSGHVRNYRFYETEIYLQDSWKARSNLTLTYGLRYQYYSVPYEVNGLEAIPNLGFNQIINPRIANGLAGVSGIFANPVVTYSLGGKANHAGGMYHPDWKDFQPRLALAYNPAATGGFWGRLLGDRKTVIRAGAGLIDDHSSVGSVLNFQDQSSYLFQNSSSTTYGTASGASANLQNDPRWAGLGVLPPGGISTPTPITVPYAPAFINGQPLGLAQGLVDYAVDPNLKTPYSETFTLGIQRELPGNFQLETAYVGRFAHRLLAQSDAMQAVEFKDPASGQLLSKAFAAVSSQVRSQTGPTYTVTPQPFFENQIGAGGTDFLANQVEPYVGRGDLADAIYILNIDNYFGGLPWTPGVGLAPQFGTNLYITNQAYSNYNGLLTTLHRKMSHGLQFDLNYTYSHSLDNISATPNAAFGANGAGGILCDVIHIGVCYGNSDFDATHVITADGLYELPIGRGRQFGSNMPRWLNYAIGGWALSGVNTWRTGLAFQSVSNSFPLSFANNVPAIFNGNTAALKDHIHVSNGQVQLFANPAAAIGTFSGPLGLQAGSRNNLRGPHFSEVALGLSKTFPVTEQVGVEFRADAYNVFNHANFGLPGAAATADIDSPSTFGVINTMASQPRVLQLALRVDF